MLLLFVAIVTVVVFLLSMRSKHLHSLERTLLWLVVSGLLANLNDLFDVNEGYAIIGHTTRAILSFLFLSAILIPTLIVQLMDVLAVIGSPIRCLTLFVASSIMLGAMEYAADRLGILRHRHLNLLSIFLFWTLLLLTVWAMRILITKMVRWRSRC